MSNLFGGGGYRIHKGTRDNRLIDVYECSACGTKFLSEIKENDYENGFMHETGKLTDLNLEEKLQHLDRDDIRRYDMLKNICYGKKVLDFGCGFGGFLNKIKNNVAADCAGVELGKLERDYLFKSGIRCVKNIDDLEEKFDVITLFHSFEHLSEPRMWLKKFCKYLNTNGKLIIEVPNANDALLSLYNCKGFADFTYWSAHLYLYTMKSLSMIIEECGEYDIISAGQIQRYGLANHLMWLSKGKPGGHEKWKFMESEELNNCYRKKLEENQMCDTLFFIMSLR